MAIFAPRHLALVAVPAFILLPPTIRITLHGVPGLTPLRVVILLTAASLLFRSHGEATMPRAYVIFAVVFCAYVLAISAGHGTTSISRGVAYSLESFAVAWIAWVSIHNKRDLLNLADALIAGMIVAALLAVYETRTHHFLIAAQEPLFFHAPDRGGNIRAQGIFPHPLVLGTALAIMLPISITRFLGATGPRRLLAGIAMPLFAVTLLLINGRGPWLGAGIAVIGLVALLRGGKRLVIVVAVLACVMAVAYSPIGGKVGTVAGGVFSAEGSESETGANTVLYREMLLATTVEYVKRHPFGTAPGQAEAAELVAGTAIGRRSITTSIDNAYAKYAIELGWVGLLLFLLVLGAVIRSAWRARRAPDPELALLASGILAACAAMLCVSLTVATFSWAQVATLLWLLIGASLTISGALGLHWTSPGSVDHG